MNAKNVMRSLVGVLVLTAVFGVDVYAQGRTLYAAIEAETVVIVPQRRSWIYHPIRPPHPPRPIRRPRPVPAPAPSQAAVIERVDAQVSILEQVATTTLDISLRNPNNRRINAVMLIPVPSKAVVRGFTYQGAGKEPSAQVLRKEVARQIYDSIVRSTRDPALLEFAGYNVIRSSVFPVEARGKQKVRVVYEHILPAHGDRVDYILPRTEAIDYRVPWYVKVKIKSKRAVSTVYSPSHRLVAKKSGDKHELLMDVAPDAISQPGPFRLSYLLQRNGVSASLYAYPDPKVGGGYFLLLAGLPQVEKDAKKLKAIKREVTLVLDRSGSMNGEKLEQVREATLQILAGLEDGEAFNIFVYNEAVDRFSEKPVIKSKETIKAARAYVKSVKARGGTNIHDALLESLRQPPMKGMLPLVLFLTDGLPTIGQTSERAIRGMVSNSNKYKRRVFTFGVGVDVNSPLLENMAYRSRASATFVLPKENVEVKVGKVFKRLTGPVLADTKLTMMGENGLGRVKDLLPAALPDLFEGDQLVLLGQYVGEKPLAFKLSGNFLGERRKFNFKFDLSKATTRNSFVPRLWASRKIGVLVDAIRASGADESTGYGLPQKMDPKVRELVDEIVKISTEFGILTEYTSFLAREGTDLSKQRQVMEEAAKNFRDLAIRRRSGWGSVSQDNNSIARKGASQLNFRNGYYNSKMKKVAHSGIQQINDRCYYLKDGHWVDSRVVSLVRRVKTDETIVLGTERYSQLVDQLVKENRTGMLAMKGDLIVKLGSKTVLVKNQ